MKLILPLLLVLTSVAEFFGFNSKVLYHVKFGKVFRYPYRDPKRNDSLFGYSLTYQPTNKQLIISAPRADETGQVFTCDIDTKSCSKIGLKMEKASIDHHHSWLGATVKAGPDYMMTCSPRSTHEFSNFLGISSQCFYQSGSPNSNFAKLRSVGMNELKKRSDPNNTTKNELLMTTFGWSIFVDEENKKTLVGGPAMFKGRVAVYDDVLKYPSKAPHLLEEQDIAYNFGYSITGGKYMSDKLLYAISSPYGDTGIGKISFYTTDNEFFISLEGQDVGQLFGASLCTVNLGAGNDILVVGAPAYTTSKDGYFTGFDQGAVFVYAKKNFELILVKTIVGEIDGGCFGNSIVNIGDLTEDGKDEIAVAAPYEDIGRGAVYIYSGADLQSDVRIIKPLQVIRKEDQFNFGLGLSPLKNHYGHGCNELAIGAAGSVFTLLLMCVGSVDVSLEAHLNLSNADIRNLTYELYERESSFILGICMKVNATKITREKIETVILISTTIDHPHARFWNGTKTKTLIKKADLSENKKHEITNKNYKYCYSLNVTMPFEGDHSKRIDFHISAALEKEPISVDEFNPGLVSFSKSSVLSINSSGPILDLKTDLSLDGNTTLSDGYLIGTTESEQIMIVVRNSGYVAHGACLRMTVSGVTVSSRPPGCTRKQHFNCTIPQPITAKKPWVANFTLDTKSMKGEARYVIIRAEVLDHCHTLSGAAFERNITLKASMDQVLVLGYSIPADVNVMQFATDSLKSQHIVHEYKILNAGLTKWGPFTCLVKLPRQYVTHSVIVGASGECIQQEDYTSLCDIRGLHRDVTITIEMTIKEASSILAKLDPGIVIIESNITFVLRGASNTQSITTTVQLQKVPIWIIIVAAVIGVIVIGTLGYTLYRCGFLRRKNKEKLEELKRSVKRQTIRRSMMIRNGDLSANYPQIVSDRRSLLNEMEKNESHEEDNAIEKNESHEEDTSKNNAKTALETEKYSNKKDEDKVNEMDVQNNTEQKIKEKGHVSKEQIPDNEMNTSNSFQKELAEALGEEKKAHQDKVKTQKHDKVVEKEPETPNEVTPRPVLTPQNLHYADKDELLQHLRKRNPNIADEK